MRNSKRAFCYLVSAVLPGTKCVELTNAGLLSRIFIVDNRAICNGTVLQLNKVPNFNKIFIDVSVPDVLD